jgi:predicted MFS family arabinose efflux permease
MVYGTFLLALVLMLAEADRNLLSLLLSPIQKDLGVGDTAMGALTGMAFAAVYATVMLPMSRIADRGNRRNVIAVAVAVWSAMTVFSGLATSYLTMLLARTGVAAAEAGALPSQMSLLGDLVPPRRRATALGFIWAATAIGIGLGAYIAGTLSELYGWHAAFFAFGAPGLLLAPVIFLTMREPARGAYEGGDRDDPESASWWRSLKYLLSVPTIPPFLLGRTLLQMVSMAGLAWMPTYLVRVLGMSTTSMSLWYGVSVGVGAVLGNILSGVIGDFLMRRGARWRLYYLAGLLVVGAPALAVLVLSDDKPIAIGAMMIYSFFLGGTAAVGMAAGLDIVRPRSRGMMTAALGLCTSVIGGGGGPLLVGAASDALKSHYGQNALRYSLTMLPILAMLAALAYLWASRTADSDAAAARGEPPLMDAGATTAPGA